MHIVPVIDLFNGQVVHARAGRRDEYRPLQTRLSKTSQPASVLGGLLTEYGFTSVYIADLNAITGGACQITELNQLLEEFSDIEIWLDAGICTSDACRKLDRIRPVFGSETGITTDDLRDRVASTLNPVLSLDFHRGQFLGVPALLAEKTAWPETVILMDLDRVGRSTGQNPDHGRLISDIPGHRFYIAGGIRNSDDIYSAASAGAYGVLLASALHDNSITAADLTRFR